VSKKFLTLNEEEKKKKRNKTRLMMMMIKVTDFISILGEI